MLLQDHIDINSQKLPQQKYLRQQCSNMKKTIKLNNKLSTKQQQNNVQKQVNLVTIQKQQNYFLRQKLKQYEQKLNYLNQVIFEMKNQITKLLKQDKKEIKQQNEFKYKLTTNKIKLSKQLFNQNPMIQSYFVEEDNASQQQKNSQLAERKIIKIDQQIDSPIPKKIINKNIPIQVMTILEKHQHSSKKASISVKQSHEDESSGQKPSQNQNPNPFREYGNFRIEYVIDQDNQKNKQQNEEKGTIKVYYQQPIFEPYQLIVDTPIRHQKRYYPYVKMRQGFRYSCLAFARRSIEKFQYLQIPSLYKSSSELDSVDTFEMEMRNGNTMPKIVKKDALRHTLLPQYMMGDKKVIEMQKNDKKSQNQQSFMIKKTQYEMVEKIAAENQNYLQPNQRMLEKKDQTKKKGQQNIYINGGQQKISSLVCGQLSDGSIDNQIQIKQNSLPRLQMIHNQQKINNKIPMLLIQDSQNQIINGTKEQIRESQPIYCIKHQQQEQMIYSPSNTARIERYEPKISILNKQKIKSVLNRSKQIISRYKNINKK